MINKYKEKLMTWINWTRTFDLILIYILFYIIYKPMLWSDFSKAQHLSKHLKPHNILKHYQWIIYYDDITHISERYLWNISINCIINIIIPIV